MIKLVLTLHLAILVPLLTDWTEIEDCAVLDSAICCRIERPVFLDLISSEKFTHNTEQSHYHRKYFDWIVARSVKLRNLNLKLFEKNKFCQDFRQYFLRLKKLRHLEMKFCSNLILFVSKYCSSIQSVDLGGSVTMTDANFGNLLKTICDLSRINISGCSILTDESTNHLVEYFPNLISLNNEDCRLMTSQTTTTISNTCQQITELTLDHRLVDDFSISNFANTCPCLTYLDVAHSSFTGASLVKALENCLQIRHLNLAYIEQIDEKSICNVISKCQNLTFLELTECDISDVTLIQLSKSCKFLQSLIFQNCLQITNKGVISLTEHCHDIQTIYLGGCVLLTDIAIFKLANNCPKLETVDFCNCDKIGDVSVFELLERCQLLENLGFDKTKVTDAILTRVGRNCSDLIFDSFDKASSGFNLQIDKNGTRNNKSHKILEFCSDHIKYTIETLLIIVEYSPNLLKISFSGFELLTNEVLLNIFDICPLISDITLKNDAILTSDCIVHITNKCHNLTRLEIDNIENITDDIIITLVKNRPKITDLSLSSCPLLTHVTAHCISDYCHDLKSLCLDEPDIANYAIHEILQKCTKLSSLRISQNNFVTDDILTDIVMLERCFDSIVISECTEITDQGIGEFLRAMGSCLNKFKFDEKIELE